MTNPYPNISRRKPKILIVDDDEALRLMLQDLLTREGIESVTLAADGLEAVAILDPAKKKEIDLAFVDVAMPGLDGFGVLKYVNEHRPDVRVIMITAYRDLRLAVEAKKLGAVNFVAKPIMRNDLLQTIEDAVGPQGPG